MNGKVYQGTSGRPYFAILKDGTAAIREGNVSLDDVESAVGGDTIMVKDGKLVNLDPNLTPVLADQYYQAKLTLGCINATITAPTVAGGAYTISIVDPVYANLVMRLTVSLLSYGTMAVLSTIEPVQARDIPVQTANFDFDSCLQ